MIRPVQKVTVATDFSKYPSGRTPADSRYSGERFRKEHILPHFDVGKAVEIHLDGVLGYGSSFLDEAFGGLLRIEGLSAEDLRERITLITSKPELKEEIESYMTGEFKG